MLDKDLSELYNVSNKRLKEQVRRNLKRFPEDFMFELTWEETDFLRSQFATLKRGEHIKYLPFAFTEQGVAMLSSVLNSERAIEVNIQIMRVFTKLREMMMSYKDLARKIEDLERKFQGHDQKIMKIFECLRQMMVVPDQAGAYKRSKIGFIADKGGV